MNTEKLAHSLVKIISKKPAFYQTGFLFTDFGHVLSVGHEFQSSTLGEIFNIIFSNNKNNIYNAKLIEFKYDPEKYYDYSILKIIDEHFFDEIRYKLPIARIDLNNIKNRNFYFAGYASELEEEEPLLFEGHIVGTHPIVIQNQENKGYWLQLKVNTQLAVNGTSGAPIIINGAVVGFQNSQAKKGTQDCFASPISTIKSKIIQDELNDRNKEFYLDQKYFTDLKSISPKYLEQNKRRYFLFNSNLWDGVQNNILNSIINQEPIDNLRTAIEKSILRLRELTKSSIPFIQSEMLPNSSNLNKIFRVAINNFLLERENFDTLLRGVVDISGDLETNIEEFQQVRTHTVGIKIELGTIDEVTIEPDNFFDILFKITYVNVDFATITIQNILFGILLDISYFWSLPGLQLLITSLDAKRSFSQRKIVYSILERKKIFKIVKLPQGLRYISFAWLCIDNSNSYSFDPFCYYQLWRDFLRGKSGVFAKVQGQNIMLSPMSIDEIIQYVRDTRKLSGQISFVNLQKKLEEFASSNKGVLSAIIVLNQKPRSNHEISIIETLFDSSKLKSFTIRTISQFSSTMNISHLLKFYFFIMK